jgi:hypothetical protein
MGIFGNARWIGQQQYFIALTHSGLVTLFSASILTRAILQMMTDKTKKVFQNDL